MTPVPRGKTRPLTPTGRGILETLALRLITLRKAHGWSQTRLAREARIAVSTLHALENRGTKDVRVRTLLLLGAALHVTPDYLLGIDSASGAVKGCGFCPVRQQLVTPRQCGLSVLQQTR